MMQTQEKTTRKTFLKGAGLAVAAVAASLGSFGVLKTASAGASPRRLGRAGAGSPVVASGSSAPASGSSAVASGSSAVACCSVRIRPAKGAIPRDSVV